MKGAQFHSTMKNHLDRVYELRNPSSVLECVMKHITLAQAGLCDETHYLSTLIFFLTTNEMTLWEGGRKSAI